MTSREELYKAILSDPMFNSLTEEDIDGLLSDEDSKSRIYASFGKKLGLSETQFNEVIAGPGDPPEKKKYGQPVGGSGSGSISPSGGSKLTQDQLDSFLPFGGKPAETKVVKDPFEQAISGPEKEPEFEYAGGTPTLEQTLEKNFVDPADTEAKIKAEEEAKGKTFIPEPDYVGPQRESTIVSQVDDIEQNKDSLFGMGEKNTVGLYKEFGISEDQLGRLAYESIPEPGMVGKWFGDEAEGVTLPRETEFDYGGRKISTGVVTPSVLEQYLISRGFSASERDKERERIAQVYISSQIRKREAEVLKGLLSMSGGDSTKVQGMYRAAMQEAADAFLPEDMVSWRLMNGPTFEALRKKVEDGKELSPSEQRTFNALKSELEDQFGTAEKLYDPVTGNLVSRSQASPATISFNRQADMFLVKYKNTDKDQLLRIRDRQIHELEIIKDKLLQLGIEPESTADTIQTYLETGAAELFGERPKHQELVRKYWDARNQIFALEKAVSFNINPLLSETLEGSQKWKAFESGVAKSMGVYKDVTDREAAASFSRALQQIGVQLTDEEKDKLLPTLPEEIFSAVGSSTPLMVQIMAGTRLVNFASSGAGSVRIKSAIDKLDDATKFLSKQTFGKAGEVIYEVSKQAAKNGAAFAITEEDFSTGVGESAGSTLFAALPAGKILSGTPLGRLAVRIAGGAVGETVEEISGQYLQALEENGFDYSDAVNRVFGDTLDEAGKRLMIIAASSIVMAGAPETMRFFEDVRSQIKEKLPQTEEVQQITKVLDDSIETMKKGKTDQPVDMMIGGKVAAERNDQMGATYKQALELEKSGASSVEIFEKTGWEKNEMGDWEFDVFSLIKPATIIESTEGLELRQDQLMKNKNVIVDSSSGKVVSSGRFDSNIPLGRAVSISNERAEEKESGLRVNQKLYNGMQERASNGQDIDLTQGEDGETLQGSRLFTIDRLLFEIYPELKDVRVKLVHAPGLDIQGAYNHESKTIVINSALTDYFETPALLSHEIQHAIQRIEGQPTGINFEKAEEIAGEFSRATGVTIDPESVYRDSPGEAQARTAGARAHMGPRERKMISPAETRMTNAGFGNPEYATYDSESELSSPEQTRSTDMGAGGTNLLTGEQRIQPVTTEAIRPLMEKMKTALPGSDFSTYKDFEAEVEIDGKKTTVAQILSGVAEADQLKTARGVMYGFRVGNKVFISESAISTNAAIHEFGHIWLDGVENSRPELFNEGMSLLVEAGQEYIQEVSGKDLYRGYSETKKKKEALVTAIGDMGQKIQDQNLKDRFVDWVRRMFRNIGASLGVSDLKPEDKFQDFLRKAVRQITGKEGTQATTPASGFDAMFQNTGKTDPELLNHFNQLRQNNPTEPITKTLEDMWEDGWDIRRLKALVGSNVVSEDVLGRVIESRAVDFITRNAANWNQMNEDAYNQAVTLAGTNHTVENIMNGLRNQGFADFVIYNALVRMGADTSELVAAFDVDFNETMKRISEEAQYDALGIQKITEEAQSYRISQGADQLEKMVVDDMDGLDAISVLHHVVDTMESSAAQSAMHKLTDQIRESLESGKPMDITALNAVKSAGSMFGRMLAMLGRMINEDHAIMADVIIRGMEQNFNPVSGKWEPTGLRLPEKAKATIRKMVEKVMESKKALRDQTKAYNAAVDAGQVSDDSLRIHQEGFDRLGSNADKAINDLNRYVARFKLPNWAQWWGSSATKALLSLRSVMTGIFGNFEFYTLRKLASIPAWAWDQGFSRLYDIPRTIKLTGMSRFDPAIKTLRKRITMRKTFDVLKSGYQASPEVVKEYLDRNRDYNPGSEASEAFRVIWGLLKNRFGRTDMNEDEIAEALGAMMYEVESTGELKMIDGKPGIIAGKLLRAILGTIPEISIRGIALSGDTSVYNRTFFSSLLQYSEFDREMRVKEAKAQMAKMSSKRGPKYAALQAIADKNSKPMSKAEALGYVMKHLPHLYNQEFFASREAANQIFINENIAAKAVIRLRSWGFAKSAEVRRDEAIAKANAKAMSKRFPLPESIRFKLKRLFYNTSGYGMQAITPFVKIPTNLIDKGMKVSMPFYSAFYVVARQMKAANLLTHYRKDYGEPKVLTGSQLRDKKKKEQEIFYLMRQAAYDAGYFTLSMGMWALTTILIKSAAVIPAAGGDDDTRKFLQQEGIQTGSLNITGFQRYLKGGSGLLQKGDKVVPFSYMGLTGFALSYYSTSEAMKTSSDKMYLNKIREVLGDNAIVQYFAGVKGAVDNLPMAQGLSAVVALNDQLTKMSSDAIRNSPDLFTNIFKVSMAPLAPNITSFFSRGEGEVFDDLSTVYPEIEDGPKWIPNAVYKAWTSMSPKMLPFMRSPLLNYKLDIFGDPIKRISIAEPGTFGAYFQAAIDPWSIGTVEDSEKSELKLMLLNLSILQTEKMDKDNSLYRIFFPENSEMIELGASYIGGKPMEVPMPASIHRKYLQYRGAEIYQILRASKENDELGLVLERVSDENLTQEQKLVEIQTFIADIRDRVNKAEETAKLKYYNETLDFYRKRIKDDKLSTETIERLMSSFPDEFPSDLRK